MYFVAHISLLIKVLYNKVNSENENENGGDHNLSSVKFRLTMQYYTIKLGIKILKYNLNIRNLSRDIS